MHSRVRLGVMLLLAVAFCAVAAPSQAKKHKFKVVVRGAKAKYALTDTVELKPNVTWSGPDEAKMSYKWTVLKGPPLGDRAAKKKDLKIPPDDLRSGAVVKLRVTVTVEWEVPDSDPPEMKKAKTKADVTFKVNAPPRGGDCRLDLTRIGEDKANVRVSAPGWKDDERMQYQFVLFHNDKKIKERTWSGSNGFAVNNLEVYAGERLQAECSIRDIHKATSKKSSATVRP